MELMNVLDYGKKLLSESPDMTAAEMLKNMHGIGYSAAITIKAIANFFSQETTQTVFNLFVAEYRHPLITKNELTTIMISAAYSEQEVHTAANTYPADLKQYALCLKHGSHASSIPDYSYNFEQNDFTLEAWIQPQTAGTIISRKGTPGGYNNGGFLLVLKKDGTLKFATDDGVGFYEINTDCVNAFDGKWHHVLCCRQNCTLTIYWDFKNIHALPRTNRFPQLNVNNSYPLQIGCTDQIQEEYNYYEGNIGEVRIWNKARTYTSLQDWKQTDWVEPGLVTIWDFFQKSLTDTTAAHKVLMFAGDVTFTEMITTNS